MSYSEHDRIRDVRFVSYCASPGFWGVVLLAVGVVGLLPSDLSRYLGPVIAVAAGLWLLFGPFGWYRAKARPSDDSIDTI